MRLGLRLIVLFLSIILFSAYVSAYDSFFIAEQTDSSQVAIIYSLDSLEVAGEGTIIKLTQPTGDFSDLYEYIKNSQIKVALLFANDDFDYLEFGKNLRQTTGINVLVKSAKSSRGSMEVEPLERGVIDNVYEGYYMIKEVNRDSFFVEFQQISGDLYKQANIIYALEPVGKEGIIIQLKRTTGDFTDLYEYIKNSKIETANLYSYDDFDYLEFGKNLRQSTGINVIVDSGRNARDRYQIEEAVKEEVEKTNIQIPPGNKLIITGETIENKSNENNMLLTGLIIGVSIIIGFVILAFILKKSNHSGQY